KLLGWGDAGVGRIFSNRRIVSPDDMRQTRMWAWRDDPLWQSVLDAAHDIVVGATVVKKDKFDALSEEHRTALLETAQQAHQTLARTIRREDDRTLETILQHGITAVDRAPQRNAWDAVLRTARQSLVGRLYSAELLERVERIAGSVH